MFPAYLAMAAVPLSGEKSMDEFIMAAVVTQENAGFAGDTVKIIKETGNLDRPVIDKEGKNDKEDKKNVQKTDEKTDEKGRSDEAVIARPKNDKLSEDALKVQKLKKEMDHEYLKQNFYTIDTTTSVTKDLLDPVKLLKTDVSLKDGDGTILIYHTHSKEGYCDSRPGVEEDSVVGVGELLAEKLREKGFKVIHLTHVYDVVNGHWNREAYNTALPDLKSVIAENPDIKVTIDLHRNSGVKKALCEVGGKDCAQIMFFNGICRSRTGPRTSLANPHLGFNLALSLKLLMCSMENYPGFARKTYLKGYRYNLHLVDRALLIEVGNVKNSLQEAKNSMGPLSDILYRVLRYE